MHSPCPEVSVIVVSYNTKDMTLECLRSVIAETRTPFEIILVDNNSTDGSATAIHSEFPDVKLLAETQNHGFARANNLAALHAKGSYILLLNPDTLILNGAIDRLLDFSRHEPDAKIWGGRTLFSDGSLNPASCWRRMTLWGLFCTAVGLNRIFHRSPWLNPEAYGGWQRDTIRHVDIVSGCFFLISKEDWDNLNGFDQTFFMYGEEADLCLRARSLGARPSITPEAEIIHYGGASESIRADKMVRLLSAKQELIKRHFPKWQQGVASALFAGWPLSRKIGSSIISALAGRERIGNTAKAWEEVWQRRHEWRHGFGG